MEVVNPYLTRWGMLGHCCIKDEHIPRPVPRVVELESVKTQVNIRGFVAQVKATLVYHNTSPDPLEVECVLPVDEGAAVYGFEARLNDRTIIAQCMEKKKAEKVYNDAVSAGKTAVLARENQLSPDILHLVLGNLPSQCRAEVEVKLVMELCVRSDGGISFVLPTILNPRYSPPDLKLPTDFSRMANNGTVYVGNMYTMEVEAKVFGGHDIARIISHTDPINVTILDDTKQAQITQDGGFKCDHDWSVIVYYGNPYKTHVLRETEDRTGTGIMRDHLIMINLFPELYPDSYSNRNEIIFVIDRSGSMRGDKIQSARSTLLLFLKSLPQGCFFNIVSFGSSMSLLFPEGSRQYSEETLNMACQLQETMEADMGGTEILQPFKSIYSMPPNPQYARQILLISDGAVWNVGQVTELVGRHAHETRVFSVGVGHGASTALIHGVAKAGKGRSEMVIQQDMLQQKVMGLVASMVQDNVQDVTVSCKLDPATRVSLVPKVPPVIFGGQHLVLYARLPPQTMIEEVKVSGSVGVGGITYKVNGNDVVLVHDQEMSLHRLAARAQINQWQLNADDEVGEDMVALSVASGVVSSRTALVGVDQESGVHLPQPTQPLQQQPQCLQPITIGSITMKHHAAATSRSSKFKGRRLHCSAPSKEELPNFHKKASRAEASFPILQCLKTSGRMFEDMEREVVEVKQVCVPEALSSRQKCVVGAIDSSFSAFTQDCVPGASASSSSDSAITLMTVAQRQKFDGSWQLSDAVYLCSCTNDKITTANPCTNEAAWATALVLVLLEKKFSEDHDQWKLLATKAKNFITKCGQDVQDLSKAATTLLDTI